MQKFKKVVYAFASAKSIIFPTTEAPEFRHLLIATNARVRDAQLRPRANVHWRQQWRFTYTFAWVNLAKLRLISQLQVKIHTLPWVETWRVIEVTKDVVVEIFWHRNMLY